MSTSRPERVLERLRAWIPVLRKPWAQEGHQTRHKCPTMWHVLTEKRHTGPEERQGVTTQPKGVRKISRADGFQAKASEEYSSAARNPEPGLVVGATENKFPQKGSCEGRGFISTPA